MRYRFTEKILKASLAASIGLLLVISSENYRQFQSFSKSQKSIITYQKTQTELQKLLNYLYEIEIAYNNYNFSEDNNFQKHSEQLKIKIDSQVNQLKKLTQNDSFNLIKIEYIRANIQESYEELIKNHSAEIQEKVPDNQSKNKSSEVLFKNVKNIIIELTNQQSLLLEESEKIAFKKYRINPLLLLLTVVFSICIFITGFIFLNYYLKKTKKNIEKLRVNNMIYEQAEKLAYTGHLHFKPGSSNITFSNNLYRLLGYKPYSFKPSLKKYLSIITEDDRSILIAELKKLKKTGSLKAIDIAIIDAQGREKWLRFVAKIIKDEFGNNLVIGANKDLTFEIEANRKLSKLNDDLLFQNEIYKNAEAIAMIGSYTYDFELQNCAFSNNLYRILGYEPNSFPASRESLINFVHNDDKVEFIKSTASEKIQEGNATYSFRLIDHQKNTKYIITNSRLFTDEKHKILIVTLKDISEEVRINLSLKQNIKELSETNAELESFNHIASHDLQEPLRKIQTFISILEGQSASQLPELPHKYLNKINLAANQMRNLINDLLSFSKTSKEDKVFTKSKLSLLLKNALNELQTDINDKSASIIHDVLPEATVVSFQLQQLFVNLISNSLKYTKDSVRPIILIKNQNINQNDLIKYPILRGKELLKITFEDNGIGFDEQYSEDIFDLFYRLHNKNKYYGTGIGLAICKKIVQNHKGVIYAESNENEGSKFSVILPVNTT